MKEKILLGIWLLFFAIIPNWGRAANPPASSEKGLTAYGILLFDQGAETNRLVSFQIPDVSTFETIYDFGYTYVSAGTCVDDKYYLTSVGVVSNAADRLMMFDMLTKELTVIGTFSGVANKFADITYDYSTDTMYGVSGSSAAGSSTLYRIDLKTATASEVAVLSDFFFTLACSYDGQLYGVSKYGNFCKINKQNGQIEVVGPTGGSPTGNISMEFNHTDKTLYWAVNTLQEESLLCTIDVQTGLADQVGTLGSQQDAAIAGLYIPFTASADGTPSAVSDLQIIPDAAGACEAVLSWVNPTTVFGGGELNSLDRVDIYRNGELLHSVSPVVPGQPSSVVDRIEDSKGLLVDYKVIPVNSVGDGVASKARVFVGEDLPKAPQHIQVERLQADQVRVSWQAPETGINNGWIDAATLRYKVVRLPEGEILSESLSDTELTDVVSEQGSYTYEITPFTKAGNGEVGTSEVVVLGPVNELPYSCSFTTPEEINSWTILDANQDNRSWTATYNGGSMSYNGGIIDNPPVAADDWLISHDFYLETGKTYKGTFKAKGTKFNKLRVAFGQGLTADAMTTVLFDQEVTPSSNYTEYSYTVSVTENGFYNIGFQIYSDGNSSFFYLTDVTLEQMAATNLRMMGLQGVRQPVEGSSYTYRATVLNKGSLAVSDYTVYLKNAADGTVLVSQNQKETLESGAQTVVELLWTPSGTSVASLVAEVACPGDEVAADNTSEVFPVRVWPEGSPDVLEIGTISSDKFNRNSLFNFYRKNSAALNIYTPEDMGRDAGLIESFAFTAQNKHSYDVESTPIKIYMANTDRLIVNSTTGWIPESEMTLVYDGVLTIPQGEEEIMIPLTTKFELEKGKNLAVLTTHAMPEGYFNQVYFPYFTTTDNSATYYYDSDYTPFDFTNYGNAAWQQKGAVTLVMRCSGAEISGVVTDESGNPVEGASLSLAERGVTVVSGTDGAYLFRYVPDGQYTLNIVKEGFADYSVSVEVSGGKSVVRNVEISSLNVYSVSGRVQSADGKPLSEVLVTLRGQNTEFTVMTSEDGSFEWAEIPTAVQDYTLTVSKEWYKPVSQSVSVKDQQVDLGVISLDYLIYAPASVSVQSAETENQVEVSWQTVTQKTLLRKDAGVIGGNLGIENAAGRTVLGTVYRDPMQIYSVQWYLTLAGGPHNVVDVLIFNLDESGEPTNELLYEGKLVNNTDDQWMTYELPEPVSAPNGCLVSLNYPGYLGVGVDSGKDMSYPFAEHSHVFSADYNSGDFDYIEERGYRQNLMIRAEGYRLADNDSVYYEHENEASPALSSYHVWRFEAEQAGNPDNWKLLTENGPIQNTSLTDDLSSATAGVYGYAVCAVYPDENRSKAVVSPFYAYDMRTRIVVRVGSNSSHGSAEGAVVSLSGTTWKEQAVATVSAEGTAVFENLLKDNYQGEISLSGYKSLSFTGDYRLEDEYQTEVFELQEIIVTPFNLTVEYSDTDATSALFTWNTSGDITDDIESHADFEIGSAGEAGWVYWDLDQQYTYGFQGADFPGMAGKMSFIVFNPASATPDLSSMETLQPHSGSKYLASFAAEQQNDDWIISPVLTYAHDFCFSFYASSYAQVGGFPDYFSVGYAEVENPEPSDFIWLAEKVAPITGWTEYSYTIPVTAKRVAIRNVSTSEGFILMIDDLYIGSLPQTQKNVVSAHVAVPEVTYEVYLDGVQVTETTGNGYQFEGLKEGKHVAGVKAVYHSGESELVTYEFNVTTGIQELEDAEIRIYPNPVTDFLYVDGDYERVVVTSLSGVPVADWKYGLYPYEVSGLSAGTYILTVYGEQGQILKRMKLTVVR